MHCHEREQYRAESCLDVYTVFTTQISKHLSVSTRIDCLTLSHEIHQLKAASGQKYIIFRNVIAGYAFVLVDNVACVSIPLIAVLIEGIYETHRPHPQ